MFLLAYWASRVSAVCSSCSMSRGAELDEHCSCPTRGRHERETTSPCNRFGTSGCPRRAPRTRASLSCGARGPGLDARGEQGQESLVRHDAPGLHQEHTDEMLLSTRAWYSVCRVANAPFRCRKARGEHEHVALAVLHVAEGPRARASASRGVDGGLRRPTQSLERSGFKILEISRRFAAGPRPVRPLLAPSP